MDAGLPRNAFVEANLRCTMQSIERNISLQVPISPFLNLDFTKPMLI
ncbi:Ribosomal RNA small subunit methyltransferase J [Gossypium arboreum]|uniref:Ribosomal RNA small subunit methyltransferase J n=1 Tax=Gossypium arboreum TaxID=29729 RepID=A0A0B0NIL0_GOSAR|nr:Ribosomal RNA small subunit methyltransferase J [Gossypium arboreum]